VLPVSRYSMVRFAAPLKLVRRPLIPLERQAVRRVRRTREAANHTRVLWGYGTAGITFTLDSRRLTLTAARSGIGLRPIHGERFAPRSETLVRRAQTLLSTCDFIHCSRVFHASSVELVPQPTACRSYDLRASWDPESTVIYANRSFGRKAVAQPAAPSEKAPRSQGRSAKPWVSSRLPGRPTE